MKHVLIFLTLFVLAGCSVTGRLERRQAGAELLHVTRQQRAHTPEPPSVRIERDTGCIRFMRAEILDGEQVLSLDIPQVTVRATARTLPERLGRVTIDFMIDLPRELQGAARSVVVVPTLHKYGAVETLEHVALRGGLFSRVQERERWQYDRYLRLFRPGAAQAARAYARFIRFPEAAGARLDSVVQRPGRVSYYYSQDVPTDETSKTMRVTLQGWVVALDGSYYRLPPSDTLTYYVSSMLSFADTTTRYKIRVIDRYATLEQRHYVQFPAGDVRIVDTLGRNAAELRAIVSLVDTLRRQKEFCLDSVILTASASPEGLYAQNRTLARGRAQALKSYMTRYAGAAPDTLICVRATAEDWEELLRRIEADPQVRHAEAIARLIREQNDPDRREGLIAARYPQDHRYLRRAVYPSLRAVTLRCHMHRVGMVKDTLHTREVDTAYMRAVDLLQRRQYARALYVLQEYRDRNTAVAMLSLGFDAQAAEVLDRLPESAATQYLRAVACARMGHRRSAREHFRRACVLDPRMEYRGNLDPEITELLKN